MRLALIASGIAFVMSGDFHKLLPPHLAANLSVSCSDIANNACDCEIATFAVPFTSCNQEKKAYQDTSCCADSTSTLEASFATCTKSDLWSEGMYASPPTKTFGVKPPVNLFNGYGWQNAPYAPEDPSAQKGWIHLDSLMRSSVAQSRAHTTTIPSKFVGKTIMTLPYAIAPKLALVYSPPTGVPQELLAIPAPYRLFIPGTTEMKIWAWTNQGMNNWPADQRPASHSAGGWNLWTFDEKPSEGFLYIDGTAQSGDFPVGDWTADAFFDIDPSFVVGETIPAAARAEAYDMEQETVAMFMYPHMVTLLDKFAVRTYENYMFQIAQRPMVEYKDIYYYPNTKLRRNPANLTFEDDAVGSVLMLRVNSMWSSMTVTGSYPYFNGRTYTVGDGNPWRPDYDMWYVLECYDAECKSLEWTEKLPIWTTRYRTMLTDMHMTSSDGLHTLALPGFDPATWTKEEAGSNIVATLKSPLFGTAAFPAMLGLSSGGCADAMLTRMPECEQYIKFDDQGSNDNRNIDTGAFSGLLCANITATTAKCKWWVFEEPFGYYSGEELFQTFANPTTTQVPFLSASVLQAPAGKTRIVFVPKSTTTLADYEAYGLPVLYLDGNLSKPIVPTSNATVTGRAVGVHIFDLDTKPSAITTGATKFPGVDFQKGPSTMTFGTTLAFGYFPKYDVLRPGSGTSIDFTFSSTGTIRKPPTNFLDRFQWVQGASVQEYGSEMQGMTTAQRYMVGWVEPETLPACVQKRIEYTTMIYPTPALYFPEDDWGFNPPASPPAPPPPPSQPIADVLPGSYKLLEVTVGPGASATGWWNYPNTDPRRPCWDDTVWTFTTTTMTIDQKGSTWVEPYMGASGESCGAPVAPWVDGTYPMTLSGTTVSFSDAGAYIGLQKTHSMRYTIDTITNEYVHFIVGENPLPFGAEEGCGDDCGFWGITLQKVVLPPS